MKPALLPSSLAFGLAFALSFSMSVRAQDATQTVVVSATRHALAPADAPAAIGVVTRAQIDALGADDVLQAVRGQTGVAVFGRTIGGRKGVSLRGMEARHTLVLVDGMRIGASDGVIGHTDFQLDWVAIEEIERIEIVRGPLSALYGAEALGGVLQIVTRKPAAQWEGSALIEASSADGERGGDGWRTSARVSGPLGPVRGALTAARTQRDAVALSTDPRMSALESRDKQQASLRLIAAPAAGHEVELDLRAADETREADAVERSGRRRVYRSITDIERRHGALAWRIEGGGPYDWRAALRAYASRLAMTNQRDNGVAALRPNRLDDRVLDAQASARPAPDQQLTAGFEWRDEQLDNEGLPGGEAGALHRSLFAQHEWDLGRGLTFTTGLRRDAHQLLGIQGVQWSPRLYAVWRATPQWTLKGGASRGFKPPTLKQITPGYQEDEGPNTYASDPALRPETNTAWELGAAWSTPRAGVQAMVFDNRIENLIVPRLLSLSNGRGSYVFANLERARLRGVEATARFELHPAWSLGAGVQWLDAKDGNGQRLERRPRVASSLSLDWRHAPWQAGLRIESSAGMRLATGVANQPPQPVPDLVNAGAHATVALGPSLDASFGVSNLRNVDLAAKSALYTWAEAPRTWRMSLRGHW